jgi:hypothetical protein
MQQRSGKMRHSILSHFFIVLVMSTFPFPSVFAESDISLLWEKEIALEGRSVKSHTIKVDPLKKDLRIIGTSYIYKSKEKLRVLSPELFEYRLNLKGDDPEYKSLMKFDDGDRSVMVPQYGIYDLGLADGNIVLLKDQYKSQDFLELTIGSDWKVKSRKIPGVNRLSGSTLGACRNGKGEIFLCGNNGYVQKVKGDGSMAWCTSFKSNKGQDNTCNVVYYEADNTLSAFGSSFESDTKFTSKNSNLWLANLDPNGNFIAKHEFEGISNMGKFPSYCLSKKGQPVVIYDNEPKMQGYKIFVSKFSKDLKKKEWTRQIFEKKDMMVQRMSVAAMGEDNTLAVISAFATKGKFGRNLCFYILDSNGNIINQAALEDMFGLGYQVEVFEDRIFFVTDGRTLDDMSKDISKLICFEIHRDTGE